MTTTTPAKDIELEVHVCAARRSYKATFTGAHADELAAAFIAARSTTHAFFPWMADPRFPTAEDGAWMDTAPLTAAALYPTCEHGMSLALCAGPCHYPTDL